jgi:hypothetical protein
MITELLFEPRDLWIGVYWDRRLEKGSLVRHIYFGVPCLVLHVAWSLGQYQKQVLPKPRRLWKWERGHGSQ